MQSPEQNREIVTTLPPPAAVEQRRFNLGKSLLIGIATLAVAGSSLYIAESTGADNTKAGSEITVSNYTQMVAADFAAQPSWSQDFAKLPSGSLNPKYWVYDIGTGGPTNPGWGNDEAEYYTDNLDNVRISDGHLDITAIHQDYDGSDYTSARIKTEGKFDFEYGKIDVVAKLPTAVGTWPAIWALSENNKYYYSGPKNDALRYLNPGEIDIMEETATQPNIVTSSAQSRQYNPTDNTERIAYDGVPNAAYSFNDYGLEWTPNQLVYTVNGKPYHIVNRQPGDGYKQWPYDQPYFLIINDALGGTEGGTDSVQYPPSGIDNAALPATFQIRSITYSKYIGPGANL